MLQNFKFGTCIRPRFDCHHLYIVIVANSCGYTQGHLWLPGRIFLVSQENQIEATQNLPDVCFLDIRSLFYLYLCQRKYNAVSAIAGQIGQYRTGGHPTILAKIAKLLRKADEQLQFLQPSIRLRYNYYVQLVATKRGRMRVPNLKFWSPRQRGGVKLVVHRAVQFWACGDNSSKRRMRPCCRQNDARNTVRVPSGDCGSWITMPNYPRPRRLCSRCHG